MKPSLLKPVILLFSVMPVWAAVGANEAEFLEPGQLQQLLDPAPAGKPEVLAAGYLARTGSASQAAAQLLSDERSGSVNKMTADAVQDSLRQYLLLDDYARARFIADVQWQHWGVDRLNGFWLDQAELMLRRQNVAQAELALRHLRKPWSAEVGKRRYSLWGQLYLQREEYDNAVVSLEKQVAIAGDGLFDHYNLGLAMLYTGNRERGFALLDEIGTLTLESDDHRVLRDRVNLGLGWHWLASDQGGTAREYFKRVSLDGPFSNLSLLGLGWAELAADGEQQIARYKRRVMCEKVEVPPDALMRLLSDRYIPCRPGEIPGVLDISHAFAFDPSAHGADRYAEALRPWQVLSRREAQDPAVQEALLASGYAHQRMNDMGTAQQAYRYAIQRYEAEGARLTELEKALREPTQDPLAVVHGKAQAGEFTTVRATDLFASVISGQEALRQAKRELDAIDARLQALAGRSGIDGARLVEMQVSAQGLIGRISDMQQVLDRTLREMLLSELSERQARLNQYHSNARLALARMFDNNREP